MRKIGVLLLVVSLASFLGILNLASASVAENSWVSKAPMPTGRGYLQVAVVNGKIYAIGGSGPIGTNEEYDPITDTWTAKSSMPDPQQSFAIAVCQGKIYCIGGLSTNVSGVNKVYDPANDSWETKASMPTARYGLQANTIDGKIYLIGGRNWKDGYNQGFQLLNVTEVYDPSTDTWTTKAPMPNSEGYVSAVIDDKIYVIGSGETQIYNPKTNTWSTGAFPQIGISMGGNGLSAAAAATSGLMAPKRIYVYDGSSLQVYDPQNNSWTFGSPPPTNNRPYLGIAVVKDILYFIGGFSYTFPGFFKYYATNEQYTPFGYGSIPIISVLSPINQTYNESSAALVFVVNKPVNWAGYSLDGKETVTITGNVTLSGLSNGLHNITVYAKDEFGNTGVSETISFTIAQEPFPVAPVAAASVAVVTVVGVGLLVYYRKRKH